MTKEGGLGVIGRGASLAIAAALLASMGGLLILSSRGKRLVVDELDNLVYGREVLLRGPVLPSSGQRMPVLALNALGCPAGCGGRAVNGSEAVRLAVRMPTMVFTLALGLVIFGWAWDWWGRRSACLALGLYALHPTFLAHGKQVTSDVQVALFTVAALWAVWRIVHRRGLPLVHLVLAAVATVGALVSKYTAVLLLPVLLGSVVVAGIAAARDVRLDRRCVWRGVLIVGAFLLLVLLLLNAVYAFDGTLEPASELPWRSAHLRGLGSWPLPLALPRAYALGLDFSFFVQEQPGVGRSYNYVLGRLNTEGVLYAFSLMVLLKTPLGVVALAAVGLRRLPSCEGSGGVLAWLVVPFVAYLAFFSALVKPQLGIRYLLPALPCLLLLAARSVAGPVSPRRRAVVGALFAWAAVSAFSYHPHYMAYFNEMIGARVNAWRFLADSNLDWEDRTDDIARFRAEHPEVPFVLEPATPQAGYILVGVNKLVGIYEPERYRWLREGFRPIRHVGYSYLLFYVPPDRVPPPS